MVIEVVPPVQHRVVALEHPAPVPLRRRRARVAGVRKLLAHGEIPEEGRAQGVGAAEERAGDAVVGDVEGPPAPAGPPDLGPDLVPVPVPVPAGRIEPGEVDRGNAGGGDGGGWGAKGSGVRGLDVLGRDVGRVGMGDGLDSRGGCFLYFRH